MCGVELRGGLLPSSSCSCLSSNSSGGFLSFGLPGGELITKISWHGTGGMHLPLQNPFLPFSLFFFQAAGIHGREEIERELEGR